MGASSPGSSSEPVHISKVSHSTIGSRKVKGIFVFVVVVSIHQKKSPHTRTGSHPIPPSTQSYKRKWPSKQDTQQTSREVRGNVIHPPSTDPPGPWPRTYHIEGGEKKSNKRNEEDKQSLEAKKRNKETPPAHPETQPSSPDIFDYQLLRT